MRIGNAITNPGQLRLPITLLSPDIVMDAGGGQKKTYTTAAVVFARWINVHGAEAWSDQARQASFPATVLIRYYAGITAAWALEKGGSRYEILSMDDIEERHEYLELRVQLMQGSA